MAYLDVAPTGSANGKTAVLLHGKNFSALRKSVATTDAPWAAPAASMTDRLAAYQNRVAGATIAKPAEPDAEKRPDVAPRPSAGPKP